MPATRYILSAALFATAFASGPAGAHHQAGYRGAVEIVLVCEPSSFWNDGYRNCHEVVVPAEPASHRDATRFEADRRASIFDAPANDRSARRQGAHPVLPAGERVPLPQFRPADAGAETVAAAAPVHPLGQAAHEASLALSATIGGEAQPIPAARRDVRVVGGKFLPAPSEEIDLARGAANLDGRLSGAMASVMSYLGPVVGVTAATAEPAAPPTAADPSEGNGLALLD